MPTLNSDSGFKKFSKFLLEFIQRGHEPTGNVAALVDLKYNPRAFFSLFDLMDLDAFAIFKVYCFAYILIQGYLRGTPPGGLGNCGKDFQ